MDFLYILLSGFGLGFFLWVIARFIVLLRDGTDKPQNIKF
jgi:hypothetical protein